MRKSWTQPIIGLVVILALLLGGAYGLSPKMQMYLFAGAILGYTLTRGRFGFAGGVKRIYMRGEGSLTKALIILMAVTTLVFAGMQWKAALGGALPYYLAEGGKFIPGTQNIHLLNWSTVVGGIIFGIGMMLAGGCGSGTLSDLGEGEGRAWIAFIFFVLGAGPGHVARWYVDHSSLKGVRVYIPDWFGGPKTGIFPALILSMLVFALMWYLTVLYENKRKAEGTYLDPTGDYEDFERPLNYDLDLNRPVPFFSAETYHKFFIQRWSFKTTAFVLALGAIFVMVTTHKAWGVSTAMVTLYTKVFHDIIPIGLDPVIYAKHIDKVSNGLLNDGGTVRNIGTALGCAIAFLLAKRFKINFNFNLKDACYFALGGYLLGFGSRFANGCNLGAMYSSLTNFSLAGWVFLVSMSLGGVIGLKLFEGRVCIIGTMRKDQLAKMANNAKKQ